MTQKQKRNIVKIILLIALILLFLLLYTIIQQKTLENKKYASIEDIPSNKAAVSIMKCYYIKEEKSQNSDYELDIYLEFGEPLYTDEGTNEIYYSQLTQIVANVNRYVNFRLIDEKSGILIAVICDTTSKEIQQTIINGDSNFYGNLESYKNLKSYEETAITEIDIQSNEINTLLENNWKITSLELEEKEYGDENYDRYPIEGLRIRNERNKVLNIIFTQKYEKEIVNGLTTKNSLEEVVETLGEPTFGSLEEQTIGYKGKDIYVFFSEDEVSVYKVEEIQKTEEFIEVVNKYLDERNLKTFISNVTDVWEDYDEYYYDSTTVDLQYILKGIKIQYGITSNHGITFYKNYTGKILEDKTFKELLEAEITEIPKEIYFINNDSVAEYELERAELQRVITHGGDYQDIYE